jgi:hypothetical protein
MVEVRQAENASPPSVTASLWNQGKPLFSCLFVTAQDVSRELLYSAEAQLSDQLT